MHTAYECGQSTAVRPAELASVAYLDRSYLASSQHHYRLYHNLLRAARNLLNASCDCAVAAGCVITIQPLLTQTE